MVGRTPWSEVSQKILMLLEKVENRKGLTPKEIRLIIGYSQPTVNNHLLKLLKEGKIIEEWEGWNKRRIKKKM